MRNVADMIRVLRENDSIDQIRYSRSGYLKGQIGVYLYCDKPPHGFGGLTINEKDFRLLQEILKEDARLRKRKIRLVDKTSTAVKTGRD